jgi:hypothetical protein
MSQESSSDQPERMVYQLRSETTIAEHVASRLEMCQRYLKKYFGVDNLSMIEGVRLRKILEQCIIREDRETRLAYKEEIRRDMVISANLEAISQWFFDLYGFNVLDIPELIVVRDDITGQIFRFVGKTRIGELIEKKAELKELGHTFSVDKLIPFSARDGLCTDDLKEYIRRLRARAHLPEL